MELQTFIKATLLEIMAGISEAQAEWDSDPKRSGAINPAWEKVREQHIQTVSFDVAVTAETNKQSEAGAGIKVWSVNAGGKFSDADKNSTVTRIQFEVPIIPPVIEVKERFETVPIVPRREDV